VPGTRDGRGRPPKPRDIIPTEGIDMDTDRTGYRMAMMEIQRRVRGLRSDWPQELHSYRWLLVALDVWVDCYLLEDQRLQALKREAIAEMMAARTEAEACRSVRRELGELIDRARWWLWVCLWTVPVVVVLVVVVVVVALV